MVNFTENKTKISDSDSQGRQESQKKTTEKEIFVDFNKSLFSKSIKERPLGRNLMSVESSHYDFTKTL